MLRNLAIHTLGGSGIPHLFHRARNRNDIAVLMYHAVIDQPLAVTDWCFLGTEAFRRQMLYLKRNFEIIPLAEVPHWRWHGRPAVALTFDDGFENNYTVAFPILMELGIPATIFLATGLIGSVDTVWFCRLNGAIARTRETQTCLDGMVYNLRSHAEKKVFGANGQAWLKRFPHTELLTRVRSLVEVLGEDPDRPIPAGSPFRMLAPAQIREMAGSGLIDFGAHTSSHAILSLLPTADRAREIENSVLAVQTLTGRRCLSFAYPNGRACDFGHFDTAVLAASGIRIAVTTEEGPNNVGADTLTLRRYGIGAGNSFQLFRMQVHHFDHYLRKCLRR